MSNASDRRAAVADDDSASPDDDSRLSGNDGDSLDGDRSGHIGRTDSHSRFLNGRVDSRERNEDRTRNDDQGRNEDAVRNADRSARNGNDVSEPHAVDTSLISPRRIVWPILLSLVVLGVIGAYTFQPGEFREIFAEMNLWMLGLALLTVFFRVYLGGWRLDYISNGKLGKAGGIRAQLAWDFFSNVTPSAIGGAPFAAIYIARDRRMNVGSSTGLMLFTMLLDQLWFAITIPVVLAAAFVVDVIPFSLGRVGVAGFTLYFVGMLVWVVLFGYATMFRPDLLQRLARFVLSIKWLRRFKDRVDREMIQLQERARVLRSQRARFYVNGMLLTIGTWAARYLLLLFIVWSFLPDFDKILLLLRTAAMTLGSLVMPTPGGAGGIEGLYALFIGPLLPAALVMPTLLIWRFLGYYLFVALGIFLSTHHVQKTLRRNRDDARNARNTEAEAQSKKESARTNPPDKIPDKLPEEVIET